MQTKEREIAEPKKEPQTINVYGEKKDFPHGTVSRVHAIGEYTIVEYLDRAEKLAFSVYVQTLLIRDGVGAVRYSSLDTALAVAIAFNHEGTRSDAPLYFMRMIGSDPNI